MNAISQADHTSQTLGQNWSKVILGPCTFSDIAGIGNKTLVTKILAVIGIINNAYRTVMNSHPMLSDALDINTRAMAVVMEHELARSSGLEHIVASTRNQLPENQNTNKAAATPWNIYNGGDYKHAHLLEHAFGQYDFPLDQLNNIVSAFRSNTASHAVLVDIGTRLKDIRIVVQKTRKIEAELEAVAKGGFGGAIAFLLRLQQTGKLRMFSNEMYRILLERSIFEYDNSDYKTKAKQENPNYCPHKQLIQQALILNPYGTAKISKLASTLNVSPYNATLLAGIDQRRLVAQGRLEGR